jgi:hypothetical protein
MDEEYKTQRAGVIQLTKEHTKIPHDFIDKFMYLPPNTLCINIEDICRLLDTPKSSIIKTLKTSYNEIFDYHIDTKNNTVMMTPETFLRICFLSKKPNAAKIRRYYIEIESMLFNQLLTKAK